MLITSLFVQIVLFCLQKIPVAAVSRQRTGQEDPDVFWGFTGTDTFVRRRAKHSSSSRILPGLCTFAHNGSLHEAGFSKSATSRCPPFSEFPTKLVDWMVALYPHLPRLSIGLWKNLQNFCSGAERHFWLTVCPSCCILNLFFCLMKEGSRDVHRAKSSARAGKAGRH